MLIPELKKRYDALKTERNLIDGVYALIEKFVMPHKGGFQGLKVQESSQVWKNREVYDDTAMGCALDLSSVLHTALTNPFIYWFLLTHSSDEVKNDKECIKWMQDTGRETFHFLSNSNFNLEISECYLDLVGYGITHLAAEVKMEGQEFMGFQFSLVPVIDGFFELDAQEYNLRFYRRLLWTSDQIVDKFGETLTEDVRLKLDAGMGKPDVKHEVVYVVERRESVDSSWQYSLDLLAEEKRPFRGVYFLYASSSQLGDERGFYEMPVHSSRWRGAIHSKYGYSPAMMCLPTILSLNQYESLMYVASEKAVDPPSFSTRRGVYGEVDLTPGGHTVVGGKDEFWFADLKHDLPIAKMSKQDMQDAIRRTFFIDQLQLKESPAMTATEVHARMEKFQRLMGPSSNRIQTTLLSSIVRSAVSTLIRYKIVPRPPEKIMQTRGLVSVDFLGQSARAQRTEDAVAMERWASMVIGMAQAKPDITDNINTDYIARSSAATLGVPADAVVDETQVKAVRKRRAEIEEKRIEAETFKNQAAGQRDQAAAQSMSQ